MDRRRQSLAEDASASTVSLVDGAARETLPARGGLGLGPGEPLPLYLQEIGRVPLLSAQDEVRLAQRIERGRDRSARRQQQDHALSADQRAELAAAVRDADVARAELAQANLRLVVSIARRYVNRGVPLIDLVQEGNIGLLRAVEKFDWRRGFKFSTYATWWIRQAVTRAIADDARTIRIPVHLYDVVLRLGRTTSQLHQELGREPTLAELAVALELPVDRVRELVRVMPHPISLDATVGEDADTPLSDLVRDDSGASVEQATENGLLREQVHEALLTLTPRERRVIECRYGLHGDSEATLTAIGREIGLTRERIRQIEASALRKLRHPSRSKRLRAFVNV